MPVSISRTRRGSSSEHVSTTAEGPPLYHFKGIIPLAGALMLLQGLAEIVRCMVCIKTGAVAGASARTPRRSTWSRSNLPAASTSIAESRERAISRVHEIEEAARQRGMGGDTKL